MSSEFMLQLHKRLTEKTYGDPPRMMSSTTADAYLKTLYMLNDKQPFKNLTFLKNTDEVMKKLADYAESTKKTLLASITSVLSLEKEKTGYKKVYKFYYDKMMEKAVVANKEDTSVKTETQKENWLTWEEVLGKHKELKEEVEKYVSQKLALTPVQHNALLSFLILSLYVDVPPRRNQDYLTMVVHSAKAREKIENLPKDKNYLILKKKVPTEFIFNIYKTSKTYGQQKVAIPEPLAKTITYYLKRNPSQDKFLPFDKENGITRILNRIFSKKVGSSMLRHIFLSSKYNIAEMKEDAEKMGHSIEEQKKYMKITPMLEG